MGDEQWALLPTELAAIEALVLADVGYIDGNDIGQHEYQLYFVGSDRRAGWTPSLRASHRQWSASDP